MKIPVSHQLIFYSVILTITISTFGYLLDRKSPKGIRKKAYEILKSARTSSDNRLSSLFLILFDRVFVPHTITQRPSFKRSALASILVMTLLSLIFVIFDFERVTDPLHYDDIGWDLTLLCVYGFCINIVGDYFSIWETRSIMGRMVVAEGRIIQAILLLIDLVATVLIFFVGLALGTLVAVLMDIDVNDPILFSNLASQFRDGYSTAIEITFGFEILFFDDGYDWFYLYILLFFIFFCTTLLTSVWVWAVMLGGWLWPLATRSLAVLNIKKWPVAASMTIGGFVFGLVYFSSGLLIMWISA